MNKQFLFVIYPQCLELWYTVLKYVLHCWRNGLSGYSVSIAYEHPKSFIVSFRTSRSAVFHFRSKARRVCIHEPRLQDFFWSRNKDVRPKVLLQIIHSEDQRYVISMLCDCRDGKTVSDVQFRVRRGEHERWLSIAPYLIDDQPKYLLIGIAEDITATKENTEMLNNHNSKKNAILNILAHDLAGPMGAIGNISDMLAKDIRDNATPAIPQYLGLINRITKKSIKLIHDFLNQEFLESAGVALAIKRVELVSRISLTTQEYFDTQEELRIRFSCHSNKDRIFAEIDEDKFMQVINNLISNALKFTPDGGRIDIYVRENRRNIVISVADSGIGIPKKYHADLFEKFTSARRNGLKGEQSTGLGMSIIKTIVEWHQGKVWFESKEDHGSTFFIELPRR
ncbi:sensor histidine kinase [Pedobacter endophyticus]|uniref:histidine kinase n=1 Tax=Pedobacter endophyticus TaxID=2789740 RepID=A0A7S9L164_9SPHI|nr:HAMP domain-containing sensor histidine kinase [Pedobacter endophyticus]QPH40591.1 GHKL domain-containing protein [Pedobacter endophyticus]